MPPHPARFLRIRVASKTVRIFPRSAPAPDSKNSEDEDQVMAALNLTGVTKKLDLILERLSNLDLKMEEAKFPPSK